MTKSENYSHRQNVLNFMITKGSFIGMQTLVSKDIARVLGPYNLKQLKQECTENDPKSE